MAIEFTLLLERRKWKVQRLDGLPEVTKPAWRQAELEAWSDARPHLRAYGC